MQYFQKLKVMPEFYGEQNIKKILKRQNQTLFHLCHPSLSPQEAFQEWDF